MQNEFITKQEIEIWRSRSQLNDWLRYKFKEISSIEGGKDALRFRKGLCKTFMEELLPLSRFVNHRYSDEEIVYLKPIVGNQNYDALIKFDEKADEPVLRVEITLAHEGEKDFLRRLLLSREGQAPMYGEIRKTGTKHTGIEIDADTNAVSVNSMQELQIGLIRDAFEKKISKSYEGNTELVIDFDEFLAFDEDFEKEILVNLVNNDLGPRLGTFKSLNLVGRSGTFFHRYQA